MDEPNVRDHRDHRDHRDSWVGWISSKVATAEAAVTTAFSVEQPVRSRSLHNLRAVAKAARLAQHHRQNEEEDHHHHQVPPPVTRRASGIDVALSHAWGAVRRAAVVAMSTFDDPTSSTAHPDLNSSNANVHHAGNEQPSDLTPSQSDELAEVTPTHVTSMDTSHSQRAPDCEKNDAGAMKAGWDAQTEISDVTLCTSVSCGDISQNKDALSTSTDPPEYSSSNESEDFRASTTSSNQDREKNQRVLNELHRCPSNVEEDGEDVPQCDPESESDDISAGELRELLDAFNTMFEQNGGTDCVSRVKEAADNFLATMREPVDLDAAVEKELNGAKLKLDKTLQRLESVVRTKVNEVYSENAEASAAAEAVIQETKENNACKDVRRRNASLLRDCSRLLAVFATKVCASILERVERDKDTCTWNERVERIASVSSRGIPQLRIISKRFGEAIGLGQKDIDGLDCPKNLAGRTTRVAEAAVEHVVRCVALAVAALQVEVAERAYQCCA